MPRKDARTQCIVPGCPNPPVTYDGRRRHILPACAEHIAQYKGVITRNGVRLTGAALDMMRRLRDTAQTGNPFIVLIPVELNTAKALRRRDWAFIGERDGVLRCKLTGRGADALRFFELPPARGKHGNCPACRTRPRAIECGKTQTYCAECTDLFRQAVGENGRTPIRAGACAVEGCTAPRHQSPRSGRISSYCIEHIRENKRASDARRLARIRNGAPPPICPHCNTNPVAVFENSIHSLCTECLRLDILDNALKRQRVR